MTSAVLDRHDVGPLGEAAFGATVRGLTLAHLKDEAVRKALVDLWVDQGVILFRDCEDSSQMQVELSACFGPLQSHAFKETWVDGHPELVKIKYYPDDGVCYELAGEMVGGLLPWHSDGIYTDSINRGGILRPLELPVKSGRTGFIDQISAYEALPADLKARIEDLHVVYVMDLNVANSKFMRPADIRFVRGAKSFMTIMGREYQYPRVIHPMVYTQAETGRKVLNISPWFASGVYEIGGPDGDALMRELIPYCIDEAGAYFHDWRMGDMVLWDNWRTLHCFTGVPADATRVMQRTTISGDYALGRKIGADTGAAKFDI